MNRRRPSGLLLRFAPVLVALTSGCDQQGIRQTTVPRDPIQDDAAGSAPGAATTASAATAPEATPATTGPDPWSMPASWRRAESTSTMRVATFQADVEGGSVEIALTRFNGQTGGVLANVNRWRTQMGLAAVDERGLDALIERFERDGFEGYLIRVEGAEQHMLAAGVYEAAADRTWFLRATAAPAHIDAIKADFVAMARSIGATPTPAR